MKKRFGMLSIAALLAVTTACSNNAGTNEGNQKPANEPKTSAPTNAGNNGQSAAKPDPLAPFEETIKFSTIVASNPDPKFPAGESYEDNDYLRYYEKRLNVDAEVIWSANNDGQVYGNKVNLAIASGDIPDVFMVSDSNFGYDAKTVIKRLVEADMIEDLSKVYEEYASEEMKARYGSEENKALDYVTFDGKLMALPNQMDMTQQMVVWVRQDWLDKGNLPAPKTIDDLVTVAKGFVKQGKTGLAVQKDIMSLNGGMHTLDSIFSAFNAYPRNWLKGEDGKVSYGGIAPEVKSALAKTNEMYKEGLINKEFAIIDAGKTTELLTSGQAGMVFQPWWAPSWPLGEVIKNDPSAEWKAYPLLDANGVLNAAADKITSEYLVVKKGFKHPELAVKFANVSIESSMGKIPELTDLNLNKYKDSNAKGAFALTVKPAYTDTTNRSYKKFKDILAGSAQEDILDEAEKAIFGQIKAEKENPKKEVSNWQQYTSWMEGIGAVADSKSNIVLSEYNGQTPAMEKKWQTLFDLQMKTYVKIVMGEQPVDSFDSFVEEWKKLGGTEITDEINKELSEQ